MESEDDFNLIEDEARKQLAKDCKAKGPDFIKFAEGDSWSKYDEKDDVTVYTMKSDSGLNCIKGEGWIGYNASVVEEFVFRPDTKPKCDSGCEESYAIDTFGDNIKFEYLKYAGKLLVSGRDFVTVSTKYINDDGRIIIFAHSAELDGGPKDDSYVRGTIHKAGYIITPDKDNEDRCLVQYVTEIDFSGSIPTALVNQVNTKQGFFVARLREEMKKEYDE